MRCAFFIAALPHHDACRTDMKKTADRVLILRNEDADDVHAVTIEGSRRRPPCVSSCVAAALRTS